MTAPLGVVGVLGVAAPPEVAEPPDRTSNASTHTQVPAEAALFVPVTSIVSVWLPAARPEIEYNEVWALLGVEYVSTVFLRAPST